MKHYSVMRLMGPYDSLTRLLMKPHTTKDHHRLNQLQTGLLVVGLTSALALVAWLVGGVDLMTTTTTSILAIAMIAPYVSPLIVLRLHKTEILTEADSPSLYALVSDLTKRAHLSHRPKLNYIPTQAMNAFTVGYNQNATIALSDRLLRRMNRREINAILAHEISHIKNQDMRIMAMTTAMDQLIRVLSVMGLFWLLFSFPLALFAEHIAPWIAIVLLVVLPSITRLMRMKLSRTREFEADRTAVALTQDPHALISALGRFEYREWRWLTQFFLVTRETPEAPQLRTHPDTDERIKRLKLQAEEINCTTPPLMTIGLERIMSRHAWDLNKRKIMGSPRSNQRC